MITRRNFLRSAAATGVLVGVGGVAPAYARSSSGAIDLSIAKQVLKIGGRPSDAITINGSLPGPLLRLREGQDAVIRVTNSMTDQATSIHWHGLILPFRMDGVPGVSFAGIPPGETFTYRFPVRQNGTYWYHSHSAAQEQLGVLGAMIIEPRGGDPFHYDREYVVVLGDWLFINPAIMFAKLKKDNSYSNYQRRTVGDFFHDVGKDGLKATLADRWQWGKMRMDPTDIADITGHHFTFLMNGLAPDSNWTGLFRPGERVRLRFINSAAVTFFDVRIPGLPMTVVQADGQNVKPVTVDEFRIGIAETYDVIIQPKAERAYTIFAETIDRSGFARGTLATREGMTAAIPERRKRPVRTMADMGMAMAGMGGNPGSEAMPTMKAPASAGAGMSGMKKKSMSPTATGGATPAMNPSPSADTGVADMPGMKAPAPADADMAGMNEKGASPPAADGATPAMNPSPSADAGVADMPGMKAPAPADAGMAGMKEKSASPPAESGAMPAMDSMPTGADAPHGPDKHGPGNSVVAMNPKNRLNEPGTGLEGMPWRVLTYADLESLEPNADQRPPDREIELHATGNMQRYMWSFDGKKYSDTKEPIPFYYGERLRWTWVNDTMMEHPLHLHGMFMELDNGRGANKPRKHTVILKPGERLSVDINVDAPGVWAFHCHVLYHMEAGMFRVISVTART